VRALRVPLADRERACLLVVADRLRRSGRTVGTSRSLSEVLRVRVHPPGRRMEREQMNLSLVIYFPQPLWLPLQLNVR
jgi:hypothetical protein